MNDLLQLFRFEAVAFSEFLMLAIDEPDDRGEKLMKVFISLFVLATSFSAIAATGVSGEEYLKSWLGTYQVTQCLECPDATTASSNLKYFSSLDIYSFPIPAQQKLACAQVDFYIAWGPNFNSPNGSNEGVGHTTGQCDWGYDEFINMTPSTYEYKTVGHNGAQEADSISVTKQADGTYLIDLKQVRKTPAFGFPLFWELKAIAMKVN